MTIPGPTPNPFDGLTRAIENMIDAFAALSLTGVDTTNAFAGLIPNLADPEPTEAPPPPGRFRNLL